MKQNNRATSIRAWIKRIAILVLCWLLIHIVYICTDGFNDYKGKADVAIILGNHVFADGHLSTWLQGRVDKAVLLYREGRVKKIYASGGFSENKEGNYPEGDAMKTYLVAHGVPAEAVIADNEGRNTFLTARNFIAWNKDQGYSSVIIVSQFYHITRSKYIARKLGVDSVYSAASGHYEWRDIVGTLREVPAFYKYLLVY
jgi:vancomycin permeability regulator SanA